jgi:hypothetical protein
MSRSTTWQLPYIFEKAIACCIADCRRVVVVSYEGAHDIRLGPPLTIATDESDPEGDKIYDIERNEMSVDGRAHPAMGLYGGCPHPTTADGLRLHVDVRGNVVEVRDGTGAVVVRSDHTDYPPGWLVASFSADGALLVVATPEHVLCWRRDASA